MSFVHLHTHTKGSLLDGLVKHENLFSSVKEKGMDTVAITEHGSMHFLLEAYKKAKEQGIKLIFGTELYMVPDRTKKIPKQEFWHLILLAKNQKGYKNLTKIITKANESFYYKPRADRELLKQHSEGLICLSGCMASEVSSRILSGEKSKAEEVAKFYQDLFGEDYYLELQNHFLTEDPVLVEETKKIADKLKIPVIATNDVHYLEKEDAKVHDILLCIQTGKTLDDEKRMRLETDEFYLKTPREMEKLFKDIPEAVSNSVKIASKCDVQLDFEQTHYPVYVPPKNLSSEQYLKKLTHKGLQKRYGKQNKELMERLNYELNIICEKGYADYFLIVWDFVKYAKSQNIYVGPGRGSAAGSIVSYCLGITNICPIEYKLLFERFLNPERTAMPDIDIDFDYDRRIEVFDYLMNKHGEEKVGQIMTVGTMASRAVVRDAGRVMGIPYSEVDQIAKAIPQGMEIKEALENNVDLKNRYVNESQINKFLSAAMALEGLPRHASIHAAGAIVSDIPINEQIPLKKEDGRPVVQAEMNTVEELGFLKIDLLGLRTLTVIREAIKAIGKKYNVKLEPDEIPLNDKKTLEMLSEGDCTGVFQLEGGMTSYIKELKPQSINDIIALSALYRPGPLDYTMNIEGKEVNMVELYIKRKNKELPVEYPHPDLKPALEDTYGVIVYQEQVQEIARIMAGYSLGQADELRRAMGKKKHELITEHRNYFIFGNKKRGIAGAVNKGYSEKVAKQVYDMVATFAGYGFNRAHAACYGVISGKTAYLKCHYPEEFVSAVLTSTMGNTDKLKSYLFQFKQNINILPPDVNKSYNTFTPDIENKNAIVFGLNGIQNVGAGIAEKIIKEREAGGQYENIDDFCYRTGCNTKVLESLIYAGALDNFPGNRAQKIAVVDKAVKHAAEKRKNEGQGQLFMFAENEVNSTKLPDIPEMQDVLNKEYKMLGMYISRHPLKEYEKLFNKAGIVFLGDDSKNYNSFADMPESLVGGIVLDMTPANKSYAVKMEDIMGSIFTVYVRNQLYSQVEGLLVPQKVLLIKGKISGKKVFADSVIDVDRQIDKIIIMLKENEKERLKQVEEIVSCYSGNLPVYVVFPRFKKKKVLKGQAKLTMGLELSEKEIPFEVLLKDYD